jgi:hypothetical protein
LLGEHVVAYLTILTETDWLMKDQLRVESVLMLSWKYAARLGDRRFRVVDLDVRNALEDCEPEEPWYYIFR